MGYSQESIIVYGVKISEKQAKEIFNKYLKYDGVYLEFFIDAPENLTFYRELCDYSLEKGHEQKTPKTPYKQHDKGVALPSSHSRIMNPDMLSDGADSRINSCSYDEGLDHVLGVRVAEKGGLTDDLSYFLSNLPEEVVEVFDKVIKPICQELRIEDTPEIKVVSQII